MESNRLRDRFRSLRNDFLDSLSGLDRPHKLGDIRALDNTLAMLETTIEVFPPLKAAIGGLRDVIRNTVISKQNLREYKQIASELQSHMDTLLGCVRRTNPTWMAHSIVKISRQVTPSLSNKMMLTDVSSAIEEETQSIKTQQGRSGTSRIANALGDEDRILQSYRRVESLFRQLQIDISLSTWSSVHEHHMTSLLDKLLPASSAWYDAALSAEAYRGGFDTFKLYWMSGMPGTGKTTITYTLCHMLESTKQLGACFFCSRVSPDCRDGNRVFPTIAYQLAEFSNPYRNKVCEVLSATHNIAQRNINVQFENLILKPLISVKDALPADVIVVIDALDECSSGEQILSLLVKNASKLPIKFIVASRPEPNITQQMEKLWSIPVHQAVYLHEIEKSLVQADITIYLQQALEELDIPPDSQDIERLSAYAGNLFIIAATMVRYIRGHGPVISAYRCRQRLETTLAMVKSGTRDAEQDGTTDALYTSILEHVLEQGGLAKDEAAEIYQVLWATLCMREPVSIETLSKVLGMNSPIVTDAVNRLQLFYACRFWADHLQEVPISKGVVDAVKRFLYEHLLFWIELVNLKGWVSNASGAVQQGINWLTYNTATYTNMGIEPNLADLQTAIRDAQNFVISFSASPVSQSTPHLYLSLLPASSKHSELLFHHRRRFHGLPGSVAAHALDSRGETGALAVWTVGYNVLRMAVSSDGTRLASSGYGGIIQVWDIRLGELASGSSNGTICIWDVAGGGALISTIHEHTDQINRLFFSPINKLLASASNDGSICLWNLHEGEQPSLHLRFYGNDYWDISFSTDGLQLASGGPIALSTYEAPRPVVYWSVH
ncbi:peptidase C14 [Rhizoctonia solani]|uniref:Peptidase C14 n=1 Tax=Rhizoctonia solani TaxID=456999 RepID=A0A8H8P3Y9_9AGAM|nr:peptidase C14 [Rhizoctonia solani]QRW23378.1 peptidase C14 [Rhizoctonia solani]